MHRSALVLFSGGQDSTTCLAWALARYERVETIGFDYGQRHRVELEVRPEILSFFKTEKDDRVVALYLAGFLYQLLNLIFAEIELVEIEC